MASPPTAWCLAGRNRSAALAALRGGPSRRKGDLLTANHRDLRHAWRRHCPGHVGGGGGGQWKVSPRCSWSSAVCAGVARTMMLS